MENPERQKLETKQTCAAWELKEIKRTFVFQGSSKMEVAIRMLHPSRHNRLLRTAHNRLADHEVLVHPLLASNAPKQGQITKSKVMQNPCLSHHIAAD